MANIKKLAEYVKGICPLHEDLDYKELKAFEEAYQEEGLSLYNDFIRHEIQADGVHYFYACNICAPKDETVIHEKILPIETDFVYIGQAPADDERYSNYTSWLTSKALKLQLINTYGNPPEGARLYLKNEADGYKELVCEFDTRFPMSYAYAMMLEHNLPEKWSPGALEFLKEQTSK